MRILLVAMMLCACARSATAPLALDAGPGLARRSCDQTLAYTETKRTATEVAVAGEWNSFAQQKLTLGDDGTWRTTLTLPPGQYAYKLVVDGQYLFDPLARYTKYAGGVENSDLRVDDCKAPLVDLASWTVASGALDATLHITDGADGHGIDASGFAATLDGAHLGASSFAPDGTVQLHAAALATGKHVVRVNFADRAGTPARELYLPLWIEDQPFEWRDATLYFAMVDRFQNGDPSNDHPVSGAPFQSNFQGGDFAGLQARIEAGWLDQLGVRALWISNPMLQPAGSWPGSDGRQYTGYHGYWPASATDTDPRFGTSAELKSLVDTAHRHGIRVLLDFVAKHVHTDHPWWKQYQSTAFFNPLTLANGQQCTCNDQGACPYAAPTGLVCWFTPYLPAVNYTDPDAVNAMEETAVRWMKDTGADGLRVDAVKQFQHIVGTTLRARLHDELERTGLSVYMVGETFTGGWSSDPNQAQGLIKQYVSPHELSGQFDFPLYWELRSAFAGTAPSLAPLEAVLSQTFTFYGPDALMSPFLGNHDVARFISEAAGQDTSNDAAFNHPPQPPTDASPYTGLELAFTVLLTVPGMPLIYQGDEIAMPGASDPDNRRMMQFDHLLPLPQLVLDRVRKLGAARRADATLRRGDYTTLLVDAQVLVYARHIPGQPARIIAINRDSGEQKRTVAVPASLQAAAAYDDALGGAAVAPAGGNLSLDLPGRAAAVYLPH
jgi:glycosidase